MGRSTDSSCNEDEQARSSISRIVTDGRTLGVVLMTLALVTAGMGLGAASPTSNTTQSTALPEDDPDSYVVEQGNICQEIEPLSSGETIESFYDYRSHETHPPGEDRNYSSYGTTHLQEPQTSLLFLHEGPNGVSLVMVHGELNGNSTGGTAAFDISGLPADAEWVVQDDVYDGESNIDEFDQGDGWASASWAWREARTDGGAIQGGLDGEFAFTISPTFNERAIFDDGDLSEFPDFYDGEIEEWQVLSGDEANPDRESLSSLRAPVTIRTGTCEDATIVYDRTENGLRATVENTDREEQIHLSPSSGSTADVTFEDVTVATTDEGVISFSNVHDGHSPDTVESLGSLTMSSLSVSDVSSGTITFSVTETALERQGLDPDGVALYERHDGSWHQSPTTLEGETDDGYRYTAELSDITTVTVAPLQPIEMTGPTLADETIVEGNATTISVSLTNPNVVEETESLTFTIFGDPVETTEVTIDANDTETVSIEQQFLAAGTYTIDVNGEDTELVVEPTDPDSSDDAETDDESTGESGPESMPGFTGIVTLGVLAVVALLASAVARRGNG